MSIGFILAAAAAAQAYGPETPVPPRTAASAAAPRKDCSPDAPDPNSDTIVVCVVKPDGYRIDPDVLSARKAKRRADQGRPLNRSEKLADSSCSVGPHACVDTGVNLLAVALTAAQMVERLSKGQEIGSMFRTDPQMSEYEYYQLAKAERERAEIEAGVRPYSAPAGVEPEGEGVRD